MYTRHLASALAILIGSSASIARAQWLEFTSGTPDQFIGMWPSTSSCSGSVVVTRTNVTNGNSSTPDIGLTVSNISSLSPAFFAYPLVGNATGIVPSIATPYNDNGDTYRVTVNFSGMPGGILPPGTLIAILDLDISENYRNFAAVSPSTSVLSTPWLTSPVAQDYFDMTVPVFTPTQTPTINASALSYDLLGRPENFDTGIWLFRTTRQIRVLEFDMERGVAGNALSGGGAGIALYCSLPSGCRNDVLIDFSTGVGGPSNAPHLIPPGSADERWELTFEPPSGGIIPRPPIVVDLTLNQNGNGVENWLPVPSSQWISTTVNGNQGGAGSHPYYYESSFCLKAGFQDALLSGSIRADDEAVVTLNHCFVAATPPCDGSPPCSFNLPNPTTFAMMNQSCFLAGENRLQVQVRQLYGVVTGFSLTGQLTADNGQCCCEPLTDGSGCTSELCSAATRECAPTVIQTASLPNEPEYRPIVTACDCLPASHCQVAWDTAGPFCSGPPNLLCRLQGVDSDGVGGPDIFSCLEVSVIPTVSEWGLVVLALLLTIVGKLHFGYKVGAKVWI